MEGGGKRTATERARVNGVGEVRRGKETGQRLSSYSWRAVVVVIPGYKMQHHVRRR